MNAYEDLAPFMRAVGGRVYDPYYCDGGVVRRLTALGFRDVVNENRDFYADVSNGTVPRHDLLMTNPPYSGDHVDRLISHVVAAKRPFALLIPTYYLGRDAWRRAASALSPPPFYVCPHRRYAYLPPAWARDAAAARTTAPFTTAWFCWRPEGPKVTSSRAASTCSERGVRRVPVPRRHRLAKKTAEPEGPQAPEGGAPGAGARLLAGFGILRRRALSLFREPAATKRRRQRSFPPRGPCSSTRRSPCTTRARRAARLWREAAAAASSGPAAAAPMFFRCARGARGEAPHRDHAFFFLVCAFRRSSHRM